jgi:hypothetical protein
VDAGAEQTDTAEPGRPASSSPAPGRPAPRGSRLVSIAMIVIFDVAGPLLAYNLLHSAGWSEVSALVLSGVFPVIGVTIGVLRSRRLDVIGGVVLAGIVVATVLGLATHNARLFLMEGSVPTGILGLSCLISLRAKYPLMFSVVREFAGADTAQGLDMAAMWDLHDGYRRVFRVITAVWGTGFLLEAAARVFIVYNTSAGTALAISKVMPFALAGVLCAWTFGYGSYQKRRGERLMAAAAAQSASQT